MARGTDVVQKVTDSILAKLEAGVAPWLKPWEGADGVAPGLHPSMPVNYASGKAYRGVNILILLVTALEKGYRDTRWLTFNQAKAAGGSINKGEKGTHIIFWKPTRRTEKDAASGEETERKGLFAREYVVFNAEQCTGLKPMPEPVKASPDEYVRLVERMGVKMVRGGGRAVYFPQLDTISLPEGDKFFSREAELSILFHEATHATGHKSRRDRDLSGRFGDAAYAFEELVAELGSAFLCAHFGVAGKLQHAEYLGDWLKVLKNDKHAIFTAARLAQEAMEFILGGSSEEQEEGEQVAA